MPAPTLAATLILFALQSLPTLEVTPAHIEAGQSCTITWSTNSDDAFVTGIGRVGRSGSREISPDLSTEYVLVVQNGSQVATRSATVEVRGAKGAEGFPDIDDFKTPPVIDRPRGTYPDFLDRVQKTLQDTFSFHVRGDYLPNRPYITLFTDRSIRPDLIRPTDRGIRRRRLAYAVTVNQPVDGLMSCEIRTIIEYQRLAETQWRPETDTEMIRTVTEKLRTALGMR